MLRTTNPQPSLWEAILPEVCLGLPPELARVDALLDAPAFRAPLARHFDPRIGRPCVPLDTYLRMMFLKFRYRLGYELLCREVADSISWQRFCRIPVGGPVPHPTTLVKLTRRLGEQRRGSASESTRALAATPGGREMSEAIGHPSGAALPRPMGIGEILSTAFQFYQRHWRTLLAITAVVVVPITLLQNLLGDQVRTQGEEVANGVVIETASWAVGLAGLVTALAAPVRESLSHYPGSCSVAHRPSGASAHCSPRTITGRA